MNNYQQNIKDLDNTVFNLLKEKSFLLNQELCKNNQMLSSINPSPTKHMSLKHSNFDFTLHVSENKNTGSGLFKKNIRFFQISLIIKLGLLAIVLIISGLIFIQSYLDSSSPYFDTKYLIQNLKGDTLNTWSYWNISSDRILYVNILDSDLISSEYYSELENTILSTESINIDNSLTHKGPKGSTSLYHVGWKGALDSIVDQTMYPIPSHFKIISDTSKTADITIQLTTASHPNGLSGLTKSILDGHEILKSNITIYDVNKLSKSQLSTILRHEFGHALGLAHSTAPEDLMFPTITTSVPFISECSVDAIHALYDNQQPSEVVCKI